MEGVFVGKGYLPMVVSGVLFVMLRQELGELCEEVVQVLKLVTSPTRGARISEGLYAYQRFEANHRGVEVLDQRALVHAQTGVTLNEHAQGITRARVLIRFLVEGTKVDERSIPFREQDTAQRQVRYWHRIET